MNQSRQWISLFCGRVGGYQGCLLKHARVHSQVDDLPLLEIQKKIFGGGSYHRHLLALVLMCTLHSGEATNPGPSRPAEWTLGVCNPSGLNGKQQILNDHLGFGDTWLMTETHLSSGAMQSFKAGLHITDSPYKYCVGGHPCPLRPHSDHAGAWTGVSVLSKHPTRAIPVKVDPDLFKSSRIQFTTTICYDLWVSGATVYGEPAGASHQNASVHTEALIDAAIDSVTSMVGLRFIGGDFNFEQGSLECFARLDHLGFRDLQSIAESRWGVTPQSTCKGSSRKDFLYVSPELQQLLVGVSVLHDIWADHSVIVGSFKGHIRIN